MRRKLTPLVGNSPIAANARHQQIKIALTEAANEVLPRAPSRIRGKLRHFDDVVIDRLSNRQLNLTESIYNRSRNQQKNKRLRRKRSRIFKQIRKRMQQLTEAKVEQLATEMEETKGNRRVFEIARVLTKHQNTLFSLYRRSNERIHETTEILKELTQHYSQFFTREGVMPLPQWRGQPRALEKIITGAEVTEAAKRLRNNRALGPDNIAGELLKYGGEEMHAELATAYNGVFEHHEQIAELTEGHLFPMNKPGKSKVVENTRPLVFLSITRKALSGIVLRRISEKANEFLSLSQHAYRANRSTAEITMTTQWLRATSERYAERVHIMGIDLSKAFDCIDRSKLLQILEQQQIATEDELRLIQYLISDTKLQVKLGQTYGEKFQTVIGTPQGDALSPMLFLIYLEQIIRTASLEQRLTQRDAIYAYADDVNFAMIEDDEVRVEMHRERQADEMMIECQCIACRAHQLEELLPHRFAEYGMQMNAGKTTHVEFKKGNSTAAQLLIVGNNVNGKSECAARIQSANAAFNSMQRIWFRKASLSIATKMRLYNCCVLSRMLYNAGASVYTRVELDKLDAAHRRHLRRILGVFYPEHISNEETYRRADARPTSIDVIEKRWTLLGHTLRLAKDTTGNKVITQYYQSVATGTNKARKLTRRGRVLTTLPRLLQRDLREKLTVHERRRHFNIDDLEGSRHIDILRRTAANRSKWRRGVEAIVAKEQARWIKRNTEKSRKRAAEKVTYERRRREAEARKRQRATVADGSKRRTIDQYFFR